MQKLKWTVEVCIRDGGAWWAAVSGVAQSQTRLKRLSSVKSARREKQFGQFKADI